MTFTRRVPTRPKTLIWGYTVAGIRPFAENFFDTNTAHGHVTIVS